MPAGATNDDRAALAEAMALLDHPSSAKRRSAAKRLRTLAGAAEGPALLAALQRELQDPRTWETQYHLILTVGQCGYTDARPFVEGLLDRPFEATMIHVAVGDAVVRLSAPFDEHLSVVRGLVARGHPDIADGALRAVAMLRLVPSRETLEELLAYAERWPLHERATINRRFWVAAAAAGWLKHSGRVRPFLAECAQSENTGLQQVASKGLEGKYSPLYTL